MAELTLPEYIDQLKSDDPDKRREAVKYITKLNDPNLLEKLAQLSSDPDASVRYYVKKGIASLQSKKNKSKGKSSIISTKIPVDIKEKIDELQQLAKSGDKSQLDTLIARLAVEENKYIKATLIKTIGKLGDKSIASHLTPYLKDSDNRVVSNTVEVLEELGDEESREAMLALLSHPDTRVKGSVAKALWSASKADSLGSTLILERLREMLESPKPWYRESAVFVLGKIGTKKALELIKIALNDKDINIQKMARALLKNEASDPTKNKVDKIEKSSKPEKNRKKVVHVIPTPTSTNNSYFGNLLDKIMNFIWNPEKDLRENIIMSSLLLLISILSIFILLVTVNVAYLVLNPQTRNIIVKKIMKRKKELSNYELAIKFMNSRQYDKVISCLGIIDSLSDKEKTLLEKAYLKFYKLNIGDDNYKEALNILKSWNACIPDSSKAHVFMGNYLLKYKNNIREAKNYYIAALKLDENNSNALIGLGDIYFFNGQTEKALKKYKAAFNLDNENSRALFSIANSYALKQNFDKAKVFFKRAIKVDPINSLAYLGLGKIMVKEKNVNEAKKYFKIAIDIDKNFAYAKYELAKLYAKENPKLSLQLFEEAVQIDSETPEILRDYGFQLMRLKIFSKAIKVFAIYLKLKPKTADVLGEMGGAYLALNLPSIGKETIEKALNIDEKNGVANYNMGMIYEQGAEYDLALNHYRLAFEANYESKATILNISNIYMKEKKYDKAIEFLNKGLEKFKNNPYIKYNKALCLYLKNNISEASKIFKELNSDNKIKNIRLKKRIKYFVKKLGI